MGGQLPLLAQAKFTTVINEKQIGKQDYLQVQYVVANAGSVASLTPPAFTGFTVVSGPMEQTGVTVVNGAVSKTEGVTYILKPLSVGKFVIQGASALVDGKQAHSNNVTVTVTNAAPKQQGPTANSFFGLNMPEEVPEADEEYVLRKGENAADKIKNNLFVKLDVSKNSCYAGEPIVATYRLFSRLKSTSRVTKRPSLSQFSVYDMVQPEASAPTVEKINGKMYNVHVIRKVQLYPLQDGSFDLDPVEVDNSINFLRLEGNGNKVSMQQLIDDYMNGIIDGKLEEQKITLASKPLTITVKPLPAAGKPASFDGAVGDFIIRADIPQMEITANETAELNVLLQGQGNLPLINAPEINWPSGIEGFEPVVKENTDKTIAPINGSKLFQYSFTAKQPGVATIPPVEFSYFDPAANAFKTIRTDAILVNIKKGTKKAVKTNPGNAQEKRGPDYRIFLWLLLFVAFAGVIMLFNRKKKKPVVQTVPQPVNETTAPPVPSVNTDRFEAARFALMAVNSQLFYKETGKVVWDMLAEKFNLSSSQLNKPVVLRLLQQANAPYATIQLLENVLTDCELALYTPVHTEQDMRKTLDKAEKLEQELRAVNA